MTHDLVTVARDMVNSTPSETNHLRAPPTPKEPKAADV
jgi:hypothetical protein